MCGKWKASGSSDYTRQDGKRKASLGQDAQMIRENLSRYVLVTVFCMPALPQPKDPHAGLEPVCDKWKCPGT